MKDLNLSLVCVLDLESTMEKILQSEVQGMSRMVIVVNMLERFHCFSKEILVSEEQLLHFHFWFPLNKIDQFDEGL